MKGSLGCLFCFYLRHILSVQNISLTIDEKLILDNISFELPRGKVLAVIGKSGSGKTSLAKCLNRLYEISEGQILLNGNNISNTLPHVLRRSIGFVPQSSGLFPHYTVQKNIELVPDLKGVEDSNNLVRMHLSLVRLPQSMASRYPSQLSGGEAQRVSIARALAGEPDFMIFDEPFSALDPITRNELRSELKRLKHEINLTGVFVTHDMTEAFDLGDLILVLQNGQIEQLGTPEEIKTSPSSVYVQSLIAQANA